MGSTRHRLIVALVGLLGCSGPAREATVELSGPQGSPVQGTATFTESGADAVRVVLRLEGAPFGRHGLHVHEIGACQPPDFTSAGGHFAPESQPHGDPRSGPHHAGDLGNVEVSAHGVGTLDARFAGLTVTDGPRSVVGRALVLHEDPDDLTSQPSGNAGARIACGVIAR